LLYRFANVLFAKEPERTLQSLIR